MKREHILTLCILHRKRLLTRKKTCEEASLESLTELLPQYESFVKQRFYRQLRHIYRKVFDDDVVVGYRPVNVVGISQS